MIDDQSTDAKNMALCYAAERGNIIVAIKRIQILMLFENYSHNHLIF